MEILCFFLLGFLNSFLASRAFYVLSNDTYRVHRYFTATLLTARDINDEIFHLIQPCDVLLIAFHLDFHIVRSENYYANTECREQPVARTQKYCRENCRYHSYALFRVPLLSRTLSAVGKLENGKIWMLHSEAMWRERESATRCCWAIASAISAWRKGIASFSNENSSSFHCWESSTTRHITDCRVKLRMIGAADDDGKIILIVVTSRAGSKHETKIVYQSIYYCFSSQHTANKLSPSRKVFCCARARWKFEYAEIVIDAERQNLSGLLWRDGNGEC